MLPLLAAQFNGRAVKLCCKRAITGKMSFQGIERKGQVSFMSGSLGVSRHKDQQTKHATVSRLRDRARWIL